MNSPPYILGIASSHNGGACLLRGDQIVVAIQEERLTRSKRAAHPAGHSSLAVRYCLEYAGISAKELDGVSICVAHSNSGRNEDIYLNPILRVRHNKTPLFVLPHHLGHAYGAYATSGFDDATVLVIDGNGSPWSDLPDAEKDVSIVGESVQEHTTKATVRREIVSIYTARARSIKPVKKYVTWYTAPPSKRQGMQFFSSIGDMYGAVGEQIFGSFLEGPGKVMGLAPYGDIAWEPNKFLSITDNNVVFNDYIPSVFAHRKRWPENQSEYENLAASVQHALEEVLLQIALISKRSTSSPNLCYAGGVALNSVANERLITEGPFAEYFIMPAAEDSGTAIGAAFYGLWQLTKGQHPPTRLQVDAVGRIYSLPQIKQAIVNVKNVISSEVENPEENVADLLTRGKIVGWFQSGSELGPRALGSRSILCDPRGSNMKDKINDVVKFRERFRPFAPMISLNDVGDWFETAPGHQDSPFMLRVMKFKAGKRHEVPAVVHIDGTGRVQTVGPLQSPRLRLLLEAFKSRTGCPILLNTSFNIAGEPIVETPEDAFLCFLFSGMDACLIVQCLLQKNKKYRIDDLLLTRTESTLQIRMDDFSKTHSDIEYFLGTALRAKEESYLHTLCRSHSFIIEAEIANIKAPCCMVFGTSPWGPIVTGMTLDILSILYKFNGRHSLREVFELLELRREQKEWKDFVSCVGALCRSRLLSVVAPT